MNECYSIKNDIKTKIKQKNINDFIKINYKHELIKIIKINKNDFIEFNKINKIITVR